jgi:hypothetical protein
MRLRFLIPLFGLATLILALSGCGGPDSTPAGSVPGPAAGQPAAPPDRAGLPDIDSLDSGYVVRGTSGVHDIPPTACAYMGNVDVSGDTAVLSSTEEQAALAWYNLAISYPTRRVPYLAPYSLHVETSGSDGFWFALPNHKTRRWEYLPGLQTPGTIDMPIGLEANAANADGYFTFAIMVADGAEVEITAVEVDYPDAWINEYPVDYHVELETPDGATLATNVYLPQMPQSPFIQPPWPVILMRTPYSKSSIFTPEFIDGLGQLGIVLVTQYFRGRLEDTGGWPNSTGTETLFREHAGPEYYDAITTLDWLESCTFHNGTILLTGPSALGLWIYQAAPELGGRITAIYPQISAGNVDTWAARRNGCFKRSNVEGWLATNNFPPELLEQAETAYATGDEEFFSQWDFDSRAAEMNAKGWHEAGWWDVDIDATIHSWKQLNTMSQYAGDHWLVVGPWSHDTQRGRTVGDIAFPSDGSNHDPGTLPDGWDALQPNNWAFYQLGKSLGYTPPANRVLVYFIGSEGNTTEPANTWYELSDWPPMYTERTYYLASDFTLSTDTAAEGTVDGIITDPASPVPTMGGNLLPITFGSQPVPAGPYDQSALDSLDNIARFASTPLLDDLSVAGPIQVTLHVSTDAADTDVVLKLIDHYPPGGPAMLVAETAGRLSWLLAQAGHTGPIVPGEVYEITLTVGHRAYVFGAGHSVGLHVQGSSYPEYDINPGNGDAFYDGSNGQVQELTVYVGGDNDSRLILPRFDPSA